MPKHTFIEVKCPKCGKQFNSEEEMLEHYDKQHNNAEEQEQNKRFSRKKALAVVIIAVLVISLFAYLISSYNQTLNNQTLSRIDSDIDGLSNYDELKSYDTDPYKADTDSGGVNDFHEIFTYELNPNNSNDDQDLIAKLPNVEAKLWDPKKVCLGGFSYDKYINLSLTDPLIQYLAERSEIKWSDISSGRMGLLYVNGELIWSSYPDVNIEGSTVYEQPSHYFTHGRIAICSESAIVDVSILKLMGIECVEVGGKVPYNGKMTSHAWSEAFIDGVVYSVDFNTLYPREKYYQVYNYVPNSHYNPDWYK